VSRLPNIHTATFQLRKLGTRNKKQGVIEPKYGLQVEVYMEQIADNDTMQTWEETKHLPLFYLALSREQDTTFLYTVQLFCRSCFGSHGSGSVLFDE